MRRFLQLYALPLFLLSLMAFGALVDGSETLYLRDVLASHYPLKAAHAQLMDDGVHLPLIDPYRSGGQPFLGNPNALPIYPTNILYRFAPTLWALNAHFWLHLLAAPWAMFLMGREFGLSRTSAWLAGAIYGCSGFVLSLANLYNLISGAVWAPLLIAACRRQTDRVDHRLSLAVAASSALLILSGDPMSAALGTFAALSASFLGRRPTLRSAGYLSSSLALGVCLAAPVWIEMLRILPLSYRGFHQASADIGLAQSWHPATVVEWLLPLAFGHPDFAFWGKHFFGGYLPLFFSLFPGPLAIALVIGSGKLGKRLDGRLWAWGMVFFGAFLAAGAHNPIIRALYDLPGVSSLRYPIKCWLLVALGAALLAGYGWERSLSRGRHLSRILGALAVFYVILFVFLLRLPTGFQALLAQISPPLRSSAGFRTQHISWLTSTFFVLLVCVALWWVSRRAFKHPEKAWPALLPALHIASQLFLLQPVIDSVDASMFRAAPKPLAELAAGSRLLHGTGSARVFGDDAPPPDLGPHLFDLAQLEFRSAAPYAGVAFGFPYELNRSPEGLDSFSSVALARLYPRLDDGARVRIAAALGVEAVILNRPLKDSVSGTVGPPRVLDDDGVKTWTYSVLRPAPEAALVGRTLVAQSPLEATRALAQDTFDLRTTAVVTADGPDLDGPPGSAHIVFESTERMVVDVDSDTGGLLVTRRAWLPIYRAFVDGEPVSLEAVNIYKSGVRVPAGKHRVEITTDRRPTYGSVTVALTALLILLLARTRRSTP